MALLAATQGTPERVFSLLRILAAHGDTMDRQALVGWLNPRFAIGGEPAREEKTAVDQTIQAALGLGLIDSSQRQSVQLTISPVPEDYTSFADVVHDRLTSMTPDEADFVLLEAFAWQAVQIEIEGSTQWIDDWTADEFADKADAALTPTGWNGDKRFNATKRAPWRRWIEFMGLGYPLPSGHAYPYVTARLERQLCLGAVPIGKELSAGEFMRAVSKHLPYLDGGSLFVEYASRLNLRMPDRSLSRLLSSALRDLQDDGVITLIVRGDSSENYTLAADPFSRSRSFGAVVINGVAANA